jgi:quercetin dioxygenase-like cupin family protein
MKTTALKVALLLAIALIPFRTLSPQQTAQSQRIPQFENNDVSVWRTTIAPNAPLTMHTHQHPRVIIALSGGTMKVAYEDGTSEQHQWDTGKAYWLPIEEGKKRHGDVNLSSKPIDVMVVEIKNSN